MSAVSRFSQKKILLGIQPFPTIFHGNGKKVFPTLNSSPLLIIIIDVSTNMWRCVHRLYTTPRQTAALMALTTPKNAFKIQNCYSGFLYNLEDSGHALALRAH